jgi:hypothetical protein
MHVPRFTYLPSKIISICRRVSLYEVLREWVGDRRRGGRYNMSVAATEGGKVTYLQLGQLVDALV